MTGQRWVHRVAAGDQRGATAWDGYVASAVAAAGVQALMSQQATDVALAPRPELYSLAG